jgi:hypothetical protein
MPFLVLGLGDWLPSFLCNPYAIDIDIPLPYRLLVLVVLLGTLLKLKNIQSQVASYI